MPAADFDAFLARPRLPRMPGCPRRCCAVMRARTARALERLLGDANSLRDLGEQILPGLHEREVDYLRREEWAVTAEDILFRRSKLALHLPSGSEAHLDAWLASHPPAGSATAAM